MNVIIVGAGRVGLQISRMLSSDNHNVTVVESNPENCKRAADLLDALVIEGERLRSGYPSTSRNKKLRHACCRFFQR